MRILCLATFLLSACAPWLETQYVYLPPQHADGQACVASCSAVHSACLREAQKAADGERQSCEAEAREDYDLCRLRAPAGSEGEPCQQRSCQVALQSASCDTPFRACFSECGGFVETRQVCTFNC
jgi:hypothetical protein